MRLYVVIGTKSFPKGTYAMSVSSVAEAVVNEKAQGGELFTAHDVTMAVRSRGHKAGHNEVRDAVHDYFNRGGMGVAYTRSTITVPGGATPYLYHRSVDDPSQYGNIRGGGAVSVPAPATISVPAPDSNDDGDDDDGPTGYAAKSSPINIPSSLVGSVAGVAITKQTSYGASFTANKPGVTSARQVDGRDTLSLPTSLIRNVGFKPGQQVFAVATTQGVELTATPPTNATVFSKYTVDSHGQIRLTQNLLGRAGIGGKQYDVSENGSKLVVKLHQ